VSSCAFLWPFRLRLVTLTYPWRSEFLVFFWVKAGQCCGAEKPSR